MLAEDSILKEPKILRTSCYYLVTSNHTPAELDIYIYMNRAKSQ